MLIVQKFGGTSLANPDRIIAATTRIKKEMELGNRVVVVVSAMAGVTSHLLSYGLVIQSPSQPSLLSEYDVLLSSGELVTAALTAIALMRHGIRACSMQGWQVPIVTDQCAGKAFIERIEAANIFAHLESGVVPVIAGFQGVDDNMRATTLGRGGSDITALAIAAAIKADRCDIYTDCCGVFSADPHLIPNTQKLSEISYQLMLELALAGSKVVHPRAVSIAMHHKVPVRVLSSFSNETGTNITSTQTMEHPSIISITYNKNLALLNINSDPKDADKIIRKLIEQRLALESVFYGTEQLNILVHADELSRIQQVLFDSDYTVNREVALLSVIGTYIDYNPRIIPKTLEVVANHHTVVLMIQNSNLKMSMLLATQDVEAIVEQLHAELLSPLNVHTY